MVDFHVLEWPMSASGPPSGSQTWGDMLCMMLVFAVAIGGSMLWQHCRTSYDLWRKVKR